jgi:hypothetical protein
MSPNSERKKITEVRSRKSDHFWIVVIDAEILLIKIPALIVLAFVVIIFEAILTIHVVFFPKLIVFQNFVGPVYLDEVFVGIGILLN